MSNSDLLPKAVVLGDSHSRAFCYHSNFIPISIGPGYDSCFYTEDKAVVTHQKLENHIRRISVELPIIVVLGEPDIRHTLDQLKEADDSEISKQINDAAKRCAETLIALSNRYEHRFYYLNTAATERSRHNHFALMYNMKVATLVHQTNVSLVDIWTDVTEDGLVKPKYMADHIHLNHHIVPLVVQQLSNFQQGASFHWTFFYKCMLQEHTTGIWGDIDPNQLDPKKRKKAFDKFPKTAQNHIFMDLFQGIIQSAGERDITVVNAAEGWFGYALRSKVPNCSIRLLERNRLKVELGTKLSSIFLGNAQPLSYVSAVPGASDLLIVDCRFSEPLQIDILPGQRAVFLAEYGTDFKLPSNQRAKHKINLPFCDLSIWTNFSLTAVDRVAIYLRTQICKANVRFKKNHHSKRHLITLPEID